MYCHMEPPWYQPTVAQPLVCVQIGDMKGVLGLLLLMMSRVLRALLVPFPAEGAVAAGPLGNTALTVHGGRVLALMEEGLPFALRLCAGAVHSLAAFTFGGGLTHKMTAHPKADPHTGELLAFAYECAPPMGRLPMHYLPSR